MGKTENGKEYMKTRFVSPKFGNFVPHLETVQGREGRCSKGIHLLICQVSLCFIVCVVVGFCFWVPVSLILISVFLFPLRHVGEMGKGKWGTGKVRSRKGK